MDTVTMIEHHYSHKTNLHGKNLEHVPTTQLIEIIGSIKHLIHIGNLAGIHCDQSPLNNDKGA